MVCLSNPWKRGEMRHLLEESGIKVHMAKILIKLTQYIVYVIDGRFSRDSQLRINQWEVNLTSQR